MDVCPCFFCGDVVDVICGGWWAFWRVRNCVEPVDDAFLIGYDGVECLENGGRRIGMCR